MKEYEEPEIVGQSLNRNGEQGNDTRAQANIPAAFRRIAVFGIAGVLALLALVGLFLAGLFWLLFAILPDAVVWVLLAIVLAYIFVLAMSGLFLLVRVWFGYHEAREQFGQFKEFRDQMRK